ncbi:hypothetical protein L6164_024824 [Bauhinia variegata]|uniref:Uncharacterized protein n=1 Tax=Bauhinia variegata TaxID=167791 RepID=A0ACB9M160_BAUVA|nr:hypothetical protein L6164_024824 [Bauhinia variegata]
MSGKNQKLKDGRKGMKKLCSQHIRTYRATFPCQNKDADVRTSSVLVISATFPGLRRAQVLLLKWGCPLTLLGRRFADFQKL